jgi:energy-converting hydrogenase Eha subunit B
MISLLKLTLFNGGFYVGVVIAILAVVGYLYSTGSTLIWKVKK